MGKTLSRTVSLKLTFKENELYFFRNVKPQLIVIPEN